MCNLLSLQCASLFRYMIAGGKMDEAKTLIFTKSAINAATRFLLVAFTLAIIVQ